MQIGYKKINNYLTIESIPTIIIINFYVREKAEDAKSSVAYEQTS